MNFRFKAIRWPVWNDATLLPLWLGIVVLSFAWLHTLWIYAPPAHGAAWFATGIALVLAGCRRGEPGPSVLPAAWALVLALAAGAGSIYIPAPYNTGAVLLLLAAVMALLPAGAGLRSRLLPGLWVGGIVLTLQAAALPVLCILASRLHTAPVLAPLLYAPLKLLAPGTIRSGATLQMVTAADSIPLTASWDKAALIPAGLLAVGFVTVLLAHRRGLPRLPGFVLLGLAYAWVRLVVLFLIVSRFRQPQVFWNTTALLVSFLPWAAVTAAWWAWDARRLPVDMGADAGAARRTPHGAHGAPDAARAAPGGAFAARVMAAAVACVAGLTTFWGYQDPGSAKAGRILIDEGHSDWEWTTQPFDENWYGGKSGYNYYCLADYWNHFYTVETRREPLTPALLSRFDILVIKTPTAVYSDAEIECIAGFVRRGGGLFLVGDHTNVFGSSTYLNAIAERFGLYFNYDATYRLDNLDLSRWQPPAMLPHAAVRNLRDFLFATSCSLDSPLWSENVVLGYGVRGIDLDYAETSYFPTKADKMDDRYPLLVQAGGVRYGRGRVLAWTDSTVFSNFFMFIPGKPELALGCIEWLNRSNRYGFLRWLALAAGLGGCLWLAFELRRGPGLEFYSALVAAGLVTFALTGRAYEHRAARDYAAPRPVRALDEVVFDGEHGRFSLPLTALLADHWTNLHTFYVWIQRLGLVPRWEARLADALARPGRVLAEVNPDRPYSLPEIDGIVDFVRRGGTLLVLDSPLHGGPESNRLLGPFSMAFATLARDSVTVLHPPSPAGEWLTGSAPGDTLATGVRAFAVTGGKPLLVAAGGATVAAVRDFGAGKVVACGASQLFSTVCMGSTAVTPTPRMRALYQVEFDLLQRVAGVRAGPRYAAASR